MSADRVGVGREQGAELVAARTPVSTTAGSPTSFVTGLLATVESASFVAELLATAESGSSESGSSVMALPEVLVRRASLVLVGGGSTLGGVSASIASSEVSADRRLGRPVGLATAGVARPGSRLGAAVSRFAGDGLATARAGETPVGWVLVEERVVIADVF